MTKSTHTATQRRRGGAVVIDLPDPVRHALIRLAVREDRDVDGQARRLIVEGLERAGVLHAEARP